MQSQELRNLSKELQDNLSKLIEKRRNWENHWQQVSDYCLPRKADITKERSPGDKRHALVFDGTAIHALELLAASLHGMLTSSANRWFQLRFTETELNSMDEAKEWLDDATNRMYDAFAKSNFQQEIFECYHDLVAFGTSCVLIEEDKDDVFRFSTRHIKEIFIEENEKGFVDFIYRKFKLSLANAVSKFGYDNVSQDIQRKHLKSPLEEVSVVHCCRPRNIYNKNKLDKKNMPIQSIYFEHENGHIISIGGFKEMPYVIPRYLKSSTEIYGRSPAMGALSEVKVLNKMVEVMLKAAQKQVDPVLMVPDDQVSLGTIRTSPGSINYYRSNTRDRIEPLQIGSNNQLGIAMENQRREAISKTFHVDQLLITSNRNMTATEVVQRNEEKMRILGPVLYRLQQELLHPTITRCFNIMLRKNLFTQAPEILQNQEIQIEYVSPMAVAQKSQELQSIIKALEVFGSISQVIPIQDWLDEPGLVKHLQSTLGLPAKLMKSESEVEEIRAEKAAQAQQQMEQQQMLQETEMARNAAPLAKVINDGPKQ
jgi:hypothetical protein